MKHALLMVAAGSLVAASPVAAQQGAAPARGGGGLADLLGGALPDVASASAGNAAGLLGYCIRNNVLGGGGGAASVLGKLTGRPGVATSPEFKAGQQGRLQTGDSTLSLAGVKDRVKTQMCNLVLRRAQSFL